MLPEVGCLDETTVAQFVDRKLSAAQVAEIEAHIDGCAACRELLSALARGRPHGERVDTIDRYVLLRVLGSGGMGTVYAGYDPTLDRKVAIKLLRREATTADDRLRLVREAQAMARVTSPNVVAVYDAGTFEDQVYIVMELVSGSTLRAWLAERRPPDEVVRVLAAAGRGLAAAHERGLVHRDFKPDNVLLDGDRVLVADFGLAAAVGAAASRDSIPIDLGRASLDSPMTATGALIGTPAYMSPERLTGADADARSDQFSFCVALYEALERARPFAGDTLAAVGAEIRAGHIRSPTAMPRWLRAPVLRGLAADAEARHPSMTALLDVLDRSRARPLRWAIVGASVLVATAATWRLAHSSAPGPTCRGFEAQLAGLWDPPRRAALAKAFAATGLPYADAATAEVTRTLDRYASDWVAMRSDACEATRVRGEQSERMLDLRIACLDRRRDALATVLDGLAAPGAVLHATAAVHDLEPLDGCASTAALEAHGAPLGLVGRGLADGLAHELATARGDEALGHYDRSAARAAEVAAKAAALGLRDLQCDALLVEAAADEELTAWGRADALFRDAALTAEAIKYDDLVAEARTRRIQGAIERAHYDEAYEDLMSARAAVDRAGATSGRRAHLATYAGMLAAAQGRYDDAREQFQNALELASQGHDVDPIAIASAQRNLGGSLMSLGRYSEAQAVDEQALAVSREHYGDRHPAVAEIEVNLAQVLSNEGKDLEAKGLIEAALTTFEAALGPDNTRVATTLNLLAEIEGSLGHFDRALELGRRALAIEERVGPERPEVATIHFNIANALDQLKRYEEAVTEYRASLALLVKLHGEDHPMVGSILNNLGDTLLTLKRYDEAAATFERALAIKEKALGPDHIEVGITLVGLGAIDVARHRPEVALPRLERACKLLAPGDPLFVANCRVQLAYALWDSGHDRKRAIEVARAARDTYAGAGKVAHDDLVDLDGWLANHH